MVVIQKSKTPGHTPGEERRLGIEPGGRLHPGETRRQRIEAGATGRSPNTAPAGLLRFDRVASYARTGPALFGRQFFGCVPESCGGAAFVSFLRRTLGPVLAGCSAIRRHWGLPNRSL